MGYIQGGEGDGENWMREVEKKRRRGRVKEEVGGEEGQREKEGGRRSVGKE